jgi:hypothetical protein
MGTRVGVTGTSPSHVFVCGSRLGTLCLGLYSAPNTYVNYSDAAPPAIAVMSLRKAVRAFRSWEKCLRAAAPSAV